MPIDYGRLLDWKVPSVEQRYAEADVILYALGLGLGLGIHDPHHLKYVYERGLQILPTQAAVLGYPGFWLSDPATGIDWKQVLHGEQSLTVRRPLSVTGEVIGHTRVASIIDKGEGKGALLYSIRELLDQRTGEPLCTLGTTHVLRGEGGFGGPRQPIKPPPALPDGPPDAVCDLPTSRQTALIYRLSGDRNPLHADPDTASAAGFPRPILHGLASFGIAGYAVIKRFCNGEAARLRSISVRFSAPVFPGETLRIEMWRSGAGQCRFRSRVAERDTLVLNNGLAEFHMEPANMTDAVVVERRGSVAVLELNRPDIRNALNVELKAGLEHAVPAVLSDKSVRSVLLTGKGAVFCAGGDLSTMSDRSPISMRRRMQRAHQWILQLAMADIPLIMAVNGSAMGAGLGLALLGDVIIAADDARFQAGFPKVGAVPDFGLPFTLPRIIGMNRAKDMLLTNRAVDAKEALSIGLVSRVVPADRLREEALALAEMLANGPTLAFSLTKMLLRVAQNASTTHYLESEVNAQAVAYASNDFGEGVDAFLRRRPPAFKGD